MAARICVGIVGAGIVGCASAFELARRGADVTVFDSRSPGAGATHASAGILAPFIEGHDAGPLMELGTRALALYDDFVQEVRAADDTPFEYRRNGTVEIAETPEQAELLRSRIGTSAPAAGFEWLDAAQTAAVEPVLSGRHYGALLCRAHGFIAVMPFLTALVTAAQRVGAEFPAATTVRRVIIRPDCCELVTDKGPSRFDCVVLSAGSWASALDPFGEIGGRVKPIKGQLVVADWRGPRIDHVLWGSAAYVVPWQDGTTLIGATSEDVGFDERPTIEGVARLTAAFQAMVCGGGSAVFREIRVGLRPARTDDVPLIAPSDSDSRVFYAVGHFRNGVLLAPLTAKLVADYFLPVQRDPRIGA